MIMEIVNINNAKLKNDSFGVRSTALARWPLHGARGAIEKIRKTVKKKRKH